MEKLILKLKIKILKNVQKGLIKLNSYLMSETNEPKIYYLKGDATKPIETNGMKYIVHICNNRGGWGAGFVLALSKRWKAPEQLYRTIPINQLELGLNQYVNVEKDITVVNMVAQNGYTKPNQPAIDYDALAKCLKNVNNSIIFREEKHATIHMPRIGTGLAGGKWEVIEKIINENVQVPVYVYDLK